MRKSDRASLFCIPCRRRLSQVEAASHSVTGAHAQAELAWRGDMSIDQAIRVVEARRAAHISTQPLHNTGAGA